MATERMQRLKDLIDALTKQPPSADRDRLLGEVRSRMVDLDTGVTPRAMLPLHEPPPAGPVAAKPQRHATVTRLPKPRLPRPTADPSSHPEPVRWPAELLTLEDTPLPHAPAYGNQTERPWTLGLRG